MARILTALVVGLTLAAAFMQPVFAKYPERPVKIIVPYPPGGPTDIAARTLAAKLSQSLGQSFVVDNVPGAGGNVGTAQAAKASADGYTILLGGSAFVINVSLYPRPGYDAKRDFIPTALLVTAPMILLVNNDVPVKSVNELIALGKSRPGKINYASSSIGGAPHLAMELFKTMTGTDFQHIPYKGAAPALADLIAGVTSVCMDSIVTGLQFAKQGRVRALAVSGPKRTPLAPDIPTIAESGVPGFEASLWYAIFLPTGTPQDIVQLLNRETNKALASADMNKTLVGLGTDPTPLSVPDFTRFIDTELVKWTRIIKTSGAKVE